MTRASCGRWSLPEDGSVPVGEQIDELWDERVEQRYLTAQGQPATDALDLDDDGALDRDDLLVAEGRRSRAGRPRCSGCTSARIRATRSAPSPSRSSATGCGARLSGYLALDPKGDEVTGATFFAPKETPGLGAEIQEDRFEDEWVGKDVRDTEGRVGTIRVVKGKPTDLCPDELERCVEGVSGATITSRGVDAMVAKALKWYEPYLSTLGGQP
ncbi:MAG: FMN-binding protein [Myxococcota bacterium]